MTDEEIPRSRFADRVFAIGVAAFAGWTLWQSWDVGLGSLSEPGSGMWPFAVAAGLLTTALALLLRSPEGERFTVRAVRPLGLAAMLFVFIGAYDYVGFLIPGVVLMFVHLRFLGGESWRTSALVAVLGTGVTFYLFSELLGAHMRAI